MITSLPSLYSGDIVCNYRDVYVHGMPRRNSPGGCCWFRWPQGTKVPWRILLHKQKLAIAIIVLCIITLVATIFSLCVSCRYGSYIGVVIKSRRRTNVIFLASTDGTGRTAIVHPYPMDPNANNEQIRHLEPQNRLLQQQLELRSQLNSQQQQNQYSSGFGPQAASSAPPPSYDSLQ